MTKSSGNETTSRGGQDEEASGSVYDFIYHDEQRIGSFLAQFDGKGHLQSYRQSNRTHRTSSTARNAGAEGGFRPFFLARSGMEGQIAEGVDSADESTYDPLWINALRLFDFLQQRGLLVRDISAARIGQFCMFSGELMIIDTAFVQGIYGLPSMRSRTIKRNAEHYGKTEEDIEIELEILVNMQPHIQAHLSDDSGNIVWGALKRDGLITTPSEISMKHGVVVSGHWHVIGLKDAEPIDAPESAVQQKEHVKSRYEPYALIKESIDVLTSARFQYGRPHHCYGITPLAIFRGIGG